MWFVEWVFWGSLAFMFYAYAGYLLVLVAISVFVSRFHGLLSFPRFYIYNITWILSLVNTRIL
jgi:hypothetical protein